VHSIDEVELKFILQKEILTSTVLGIIDHRLKPVVYTFGRKPDFSAVRPIYNAS